MVLGEELLASGERDGDQMVSVEGLYLLGVTAFWQGRLTDSRRYLEEAITRYQPARHREHLALYAQDPKVVCLSRLAWTLWHLGFPERSARMRDESLVLADSLADPYSRAYALWYALFPAIDMGDSDVVRQYVEAMQRVAADHNLLYIAAVVESFAGYRDTLDGAVDGGIARMEAALSDPRAAGQEFVLRPQTLLLLAHAHAAAGRHDGALSAVEKGIDFAKRGARIWAGEFHRLRAESLVARGSEESEIESAFRQAIEVGREQQSAWIERHSAVGLARWREKRDPQTLSKRSVPKMTP
jgi:tetratricopeptide (TPR) repeat protein